MRAWEEFLVQLEKELSEESVKKWLRPLRVTHFDARNLHLEADTPFQVSWFNEQIRPKVKAALLTSSSKPMRVVLRIANERKKSERKQQVPTAQVQFRGDTLDPGAIYREFLFGPTEWTAKVIQELIAAFPAPYSMNPVFIHGACGKSHLLMGIARELALRAKPVLYVRAPTFVRELVTAVRMGEMGRFREFYRAAKALIIDDVHLLHEKFGVQEELFHTFNALHGSHIPLIFSAPGAPATLQGFEPRLLSRFEWGVVLPLAQCDRGMFEEILRRFKRKLDLTLAPAADSLLLDAYSHPRELLKALQLVALRLHMDGPMRDEIQLLSGIIEELKGQGEDRAETIVRTAAAHFGLTPAELKGKNRERQVTLVRNIAMALTRRELKLSYPQIGRLFARTHTSVLRAIQDIESSGDAEVRAALIAITQRLS